MNKAPVKLSLRKLLIATLAIGPLAILPAPLWALPTTSQYTVTNGTATLATGTGSFQVTPGTVIVWGNNTTVNNTFTANTFNILTGETWTFGGITGNQAVLNKIGYLPNGALGTSDNATINGTLSSQGKVFIQANGNIIVNSGAIINTNGLVLSTLQTTNDFNFTTTGAVDVTGSNVGNVTLNMSNTAVGGVSVYSGNITYNQISVAGDLLLNQASSASAAPLNLASGAAGSVSGNLSVVTNNGAVTQTNALTVTGLTSLTTGNVVAGNAVTLLNSGNSFKTITLNVGNSTTVGTSNILTTSDVTLAASTVGENFTINSTGGNISTSGAVAVVGNANLITATANKTINFGNGSTVGNTIAASTVGSLGNITINTAGNLSTAAINAAGGAPISVTTANVLNVNGTIVTTGNIGLTGGNINSVPAGLVAGATNGSVAAGAVTITATGSGGNVVLPGVAAASINVTTTGGGSISQGGNTVGLTVSGGSVTLNAGVTAGSTGNISINSANPLTGNTTVILTGNNISVGSTGNVVIGAVSAAGNVTINTLWSGAAGTGTVQLGNSSGSNFPSFSIPNGGLTVTTNGAVVADDNYGQYNIFGALSINTTGNGTTTAGANVTMNAAASNPAGSSIGKFGAVTINAGTAGNIIVSKTGLLHISNVTGNVIQLRSTNSDILIDGPIVTTTTFAGNNTVGNSAISMNASSGNITETANGVITTTQAAAAVSMVSNNTTGFGANLSNSQNAFAGPVSITGGANDIVMTNSSFILANTSNVSSTNLSITTTGGSSNLITVNGGNYSNLTLTSAGMVTLAGGTYKALTINASDSSPTSIQQTGAITVNGTLTLTSQGNTSLGTVTNNITGNVVLANAVKDVTVASGRNLTVSGTGYGNLTAIAGGNAGSFSNTWNVFLGNLSVANLTAVALNGNTALNVGTGNATAGNSGNITQLAGSSLFVFGGANFTTYNGNIVVANNGNNFSTVQASTGGATGAAGIYASSTGVGVINLTKDSSMRVGDINSAGAVTLTSRFGSIFENNRGTAVSIVANGTPGLTLNAPNGSIALGNVTGTTTANITTVNLVAGLGAALYTNYVSVNNSVGTFALGNINANSLQVTANAVSITQSQPIWVYGLSNFTVTGNATNGGSITLNNTANNFGPLVLSTNVTAGNISVTKGSTLNLRTVSMPAGSTGNFTGISVTSDIKSTGFAGVKPGGTTASPGTGVVTLVAANGAGNITVGDATADFPTTGGLVFNGNNVSISVLGNSNLYLGSPTAASVAKGNLTIQTILGSILETPQSNGTNTAVSVTGNASFNAPSGSITLGSAANQFGSIQFQGSSVNIQQTNDIVIASGSYATGPASFNTSGNLSISTTLGTGGAVSFSNSVNMGATGNITLSSMNALGQLTVSAAGTKDLSKLSLSGNLNGKTPNNLGTGAYIAPAP